MKCPTYKFYGRLNFIKTIVNEWSEGNFKLSSSISQDLNNIITGKNNEFLPSTSTSDAGCIFSHPNVIPVNMKIYKYDSKDTEKRKTERIRKYCHWIQKRSKDFQH